MMSHDTFIEGKHVLLRPVREEDATLYTSWINDPLVRRYLLSRFPQSLLAEKEWVQKKAKIEAVPREITLVIESKADHKAIGLIGMHDVSWIDRRCTTGTNLGDKDYHGKGLATDAKMHFLKYLFETLGMHKVVSRAHAANTKSIRYSERCGYVREATLKDELFHEGAFVDMVVLACFYDLWKVKWDEYVSGA